MILMHPRVIYLVSECDLIRPLALFLPLELDPGLLVLELRAHLLNIGFVVLPDVAITETWVLGLVCLVPSRVASPQISHLYPVHHLFECPRGVPLIQRICKPYSFHFIYNTSSYL